MKKHTRRILIYGFVSWIIFTCGAGLFFLFSSPDVRNAESDKGGKLPQQICKGTEGSSRILEDSIGRVRLYSQAREGAEDAASTTVQSSDCGKTGSTGAHIAKNKDTSSTMSANSDMPSVFTIEEIPGTNHDPIDTAVVLQEKETDLGRSGLRRKVKIVEVDWKYPKLRVSDVYQKLSRNAEEKRISRTICVADHVLVRLTRGALTRDLEKICASLDAEITRKPGSENMAIIRFKAEDTDSVLNTIHALQKEEIVEAAEPDYVANICGNIPNDPNFSLLWGMNNADDADIDAPEAWEYARGSDTVTVAVIDTGVDAGHADLQENIYTNENEIPNNGIDDDQNGYVDDVHGWNFVHDNNNPHDDHWHGTHCAGSVGARGNNGIGVAGVAWRVKIVPIKILNSQGYGYYSDIVPAIYYTTRLGVDLTSNSWGGGGSCSCLYSAIADADQAGILFVAAAGNSSLNADVYPHYPSGYSCDNIVSVAASNRSDNRAYFSNYGASSVDVAAPGQSILSCYPGNRYTYASGTSMATPHVAGALAVLKAHRPEMTGPELKTRLMQSVDVLSSFTGLCQSNGRINLAEAVNVAENNAPPVADDQSLVTAEDTPLDITLTATDPEDNEIIYSIASHPEHGTVTGTPPNVTYTPDENYSGADGFTFSVRDQYWPGNTAEIRILITPVNDVPLAVSKSVLVERNDEQAFSLFAEDPDGDFVSYGVDVFPQHGTLTGSAPDFIYTPRQGYVGEDVLEYTATDGLGSSQAAQICFTVRQPVDGYSIVDLGTLEGAASFGYALNDSGEAAGMTFDAGDRPQAFYVDSSLTFHHIFQYPASEARGISTSGRVAGFREDAAGKLYPALCTGGSEQILSVPGSGSGAAYAISPDGSRVAGIYEASASAWHAILWTDNLPVSLGQGLGPFSSAEGVADSGTVVGWRLDDAGVSRAVLWKNSNTINIGEDFSLDSFGTCIDAHGRGAGYARFADSTVHAILWEDLESTDLGGAENGFSRAYGINRYAQVVGSFNTASDNRHACIWHGGEMKDLNTLLLNDTEWELAEAWAINENGQIVGSGSRNGEWHAFRLTPVTAGQTPHADNQSVDVYEDTPAAITLTGSSPSGRPLTFEIVSHPEHGRLDGTAPDLIYTPASNYPGTDTFTFRVSDGVITSNTAAVTLSIAQSNDKPSAADLRLKTACNTARGIYLLATDPDGDALSYIVGDPEHGTLSGTAPNLTYTPETDYTGNDSFTFRVDDGSVQSDPAIVTITVLEELTGYRLSDLGTLGGTSSQATAINEAGQVVGQSRNADNKLRAFVWDESNGISSLGTLGGETSAANDINDFGWIVGTSGNLGGSVRAFVYRDGSMEDIGTLGGNQAEAMSVNNAGQIVGFSVDGSADTAPFLWNNTTMTPLGNLGDYPARAMSVNNSGQAAGWSRRDNGVIHGFVRLTDSLEDLGGLDTVASHARDINDSGQIAGWSYNTAEGAYHAVIWEDGTMTDLGTLGGASYAFAVNNRSQAVGYSFNGSGKQLAIIWAGSSVRDLNELVLNPDGYVVTEAVDINDNGVIAASGSKAGVTHALVLVPMYSDEYPEAHNGSVTTDEDTSVNITLTADSPTGNPLTFQVVGNPQHGTLSGTAPNITYQPEADWYGTDRLTFKATNGVSDSNLAAITITVDPVNDAPQAADMTVTVPEDSKGGFTLQASDMDHDTLTYTVIAQPSHGTLSGTAPKLYYTPDANYNGSDTMEFHVNDGSVQSETATVSITITPVNDLPTVGDMSVSTDEDQAKEIAFSGADTDGDDLTYRIVSAPSHGTISESDGVFTYTPAADYYGSDLLTYQAHDGKAASNTATVTVTVNAVNDAPEVEDGQADTLVGQAVSMTLRGSDKETSSLNYSISSPPNHGTLSGTLPNVTYTPDAGYWGKDTFTFKASDGSLESAPGTITLHMKRPPVAGDVSATVNEDESGNVTLDGQDDDGDTLVYTIKTQPSHGSLSGAPPNLTYTPQVDYNGSDSFTYTVSDSMSESNTATVRITVTPVNDAPAAHTLTETTPEEDALVLTLSGSDLEGDSLTFSVVTRPAHGSLSGNPPTLTYTPVKDYNGTDTFTFRAFDGAAYSQPATVSITVAPVNDAPEAEAGQALTSVNIPVSIPLTGSDVDGDTLTFSVTTRPSHGTISGESPVFIYTPEDGYYGTDSFTFKASDGKLTSGEAMVSITIQRPPAVEDLEVATDEDTSADITLQGADPENDPITYAVVREPSHGELSGDMPNLVYAPDANYFGADSFTYRVHDGHTHSRTATVSIEIASVNDSPRAQGADVLTSVDRAVEIELSGSDIESSELIYSIVTAPLNGTLSGDAPRLTYTPAVGYKGADSFVFKVSDGELWSDPAPVTIHVQHPPAAHDMDLETKEDTALSITLNATDEDNDTLTYEIVSSPATGELTGTPPNLTYYPDADFNGSDSFTYRAADSFTNSNTATVTITITSVNDAPVAENLSAETAEETAVDIPLSGSDQEGDDMSFLIVGQPVRGSITGTPPNVTYTPETDFTGTDSFRYAASDSSGTGPAATVSITVTPVNDAPRAFDGSAEIPAGRTAEIVLSAFDIDGDVLDFAIATRPSHGELSGSGARHSYVPEAGFCGTDRFTFKATDGELSSNAAEFVIEVVNQAPVVNAGTDGTITLPASARLFGTASDDGCPSAPGKVSTQWSLAGGPGTLTFEDSTALSTSVTADKAGMYIIRLTATDGQLSAADDVRLMVLPDPDKDSDGDGMPDIWEEEYGLNPNDASDAELDNDNDGLSNLYEFMYGISPVNPDSDGDGMNDGWEVDNSFDPADDTDAAEDADNDGFTNLEEYTSGTDPHTPCTPAVDAGKDRMVVTGRVVTLGCTAGHPGGKAIVETFWSFEELPGNSSAVVEQETTDTSAEFIPDATGLFRLHVQVTDENGMTAEDVVNITAYDPLENLPPNADAGVDLYGRIGQTTSLFGGNSSDPDSSDPLIYKWKILIRPQGSTANLQDANTKTPIIVPDVAGTYAAALQVTDSFGAFSPEITVQTMGKETMPGDGTVYIQVSGDGLNPPRAEAGADPVGENGTQVILDGSASGDLDGDPITFSWIFVSRPPASRARLIDPTSETPSFTPDRTGRYEILLKVTDSYGLSDMDTVQVISVSESEIAPQAEAGELQILDAGLEDLAVGLNGLESIAAEQGTTYRWSQIEGPVVALSNDMSAAPDFVISSTREKRASVYTFLLAVTDPNGITVTDTVSVVVNTEDEHVPEIREIRSAEGEAVGEDTSVPVGRAFEITAAVDTGGDKDEPLVVYWTQASGPPAAFSMATTGAADYDKLSFTPTEPGRYVFNAYVDDGKPLSLVKTVSFVAEPAAEETGTETDSDADQTAEDTDDTVSQTTAQNTAPSSGGSGGGGGCFISMLR